MAAFAPEIITYIGPLPITNTLLHTLIVDGVIIGTAIYLSKRIYKIPRGVQSVVEPLLEAMYNLTESIASSKKATRAIFPYVMTFFLFILVANFTGLFPGVGTIGFFEGDQPHAFSSSVANAASTDVIPDSPPMASLAFSGIGDQDSRLHGNDKKEVGVEKTEATNAEHTATFKPLLRGATSDINVTLALAVISVVATHMLSIQVTGIKDYITRYFSFNPVNLYVGLLELVAEFTKIISLSFRLFGNIFAGEIALHTISKMFAFLAPLPFLLLESIVSVVQALVFSILTLVFMAVLTTPHHAHEKTSEH